MLAELAASDPELAAEVETLLMADGEAEAGFLEPPVETVTAVVGQRIGQGLEGRRVGNWRIERLIARGGMGSVYQARREGEYEQVAALKLVRQELLDPLLVEAFNRERQLLARLQHPGIARLYDGGTSADGMPWLAMEYVDGLPIDSYCDRHQLDINARLLLVEKICAALSHAHRNLVIHRDIKPSNILVGEDGEPKLLDFGIARLIVDDSASPATATVGRRLTPAYASPEQFQGQPIGAASDIYSLGVLLYQLLAGALPYRIDHDLPAVEAERLICHADPAPPSRRLLETLAGDSALAGQRSTTPERLHRLLRGDLDVIVMKTLRKEPEQRYASADALAEDLRRYRDRLPISARPPTLAYRSRKFISRHRLGLAGTAVAFAALTVALFAVIAQSQQAKLERDRAMLINEFLQSVLIEADPYQSGAEATIREVLERAGLQVGQRFADQPDLEAGLRRTIGYTQVSLMDLEAAELNLTRALELKQALYPPDDERVLRTRAHLAWLAYENWDIDAAVSAYSEIISALGPGHEADFRASLYNDYGAILNYREDYGEAIELFERALVLWTELPGSDQQLATVHSNLGYAWSGLGNDARAEQYYKLGLDHGRRANEQVLYPDLGIQLNNYGVLMAGQGRYEEALPLYRESVEVRTLTLGEDHPGTGLGLANLGGLLLDLGQTDEAQTHLARALAIFDGAGLAPDHLHLLLARGRLARIQALGGEPAAAADTLQMVHDRLADADLVHRSRLEFAVWLAEAERDAGWPERGRETARVALSDARTRLGEEDPISRALAELAEDASALSAAAAEQADRQQ